MPRSRFPYVLKQTTRHGKTVWYYRRGKGERIRLPDTYGSPEFIKAYQAAVTGAPQLAERATGQRGTLEWLCRQYMASAKFAQASASTQKQRRLTLHKICQNSGSYPYAQFQKHHITAGLDARASTPAAANWYLKVVKALFTWAVDAGHLDSNPAQDVKGLRNRTPGFIPWTDKDVEAFRAHWPIGTKQRLALELLAGTGLRRGDAVRLGPEHVQDGMISIETEKVGVAAFMAVPDALRSAIESTETGATFLITEKGEPYSKEGFANWFRRACAAAGVTGSPHGIRKWAAAKDAEAGATEMELQAKYGWLTSSQSSVYTKSADRKRLAKGLAQKSKTPHPVTGEGQGPENIAKSMAKKSSGTP